METERDALRTGTVALEARLAQAAGALNAADELKELRWDGGRCALVGWGGLGSGTVGWAELA